MNSETQSVRLMVVSLLFCLTFFTGSARANDPATTDCSNLSLDQQVYAPNFEWDFFWSTYVSPWVEPFSDSRVRLQGYWSEQLFPPLGYGTYQTRIKLPYPHGELSVFFGSINTTYRIWINGQLVDSYGSIDDCASNANALRSVLVNVPADARYADMIIQVRNCTRARGGVPREILIGGKDSMLAELNVRRGTEIFIVGSLIAMAVVHLILFSISYKHKSYFLLAAICLVIGVKALIGSHLLPDLFPQLDDDVWSRLELVSVYSLLYLFPLYIRSIFKTFLNRVIMMVLLAAALTLEFFVFFTPQFSFIKFLNVFQGLMGALMIYAVIHSWRLRKEKQIISTIIFWGLFFSTPFFLAEFLKFSGLFPAMARVHHLAEIGMLIFLTFQCYLLSKLNAEAQTQLQIINTNLEHLIEHKTAELKSSNEVKDILLSVISHDMRNPILSLKGMIKIVRKSSFDQKTFLDHCGRIEEKLESVSHLVDNILFWSSSQINGFVAKHTSVDVAELVEEQIDLFRDQADQKNIYLKNLVPNDIRIVVDRDIVNLSIRNFLSNAIKFSNERGEIILSVTQDDRLASIHVKDSGVGMPAEVIKNLFSENNGLGASSRTGTKSEEGAGIGLKLCNYYIKKMGAKMDIHSGPAIGTVISIVGLPLQ